MAGSFRPDVLLGRLAEGGVDFVVIGDVAVVAQASPRLTKDLDVTYATDHDNLDRLGGVLTELDTQLRGAHETVPFVPDARTLRRTQILTLDTELGALDLLVDPSGCPPYPELQRAADVIELDGHEIRIASIEHLISMKRAAGRNQDLVDIEALEIVLRRRGQRR